MEPLASTGSGSHSRKCTVSGCTAGVETDSCRAAPPPAQKGHLRSLRQCLRPPDPQHHTGTLDWVQTSTTHEQKWTCCGTILVAQEAHQWENGICAQCGYGCAHTGGTATCHTKAVRTAAATLTASRTRATTPAATLWMATPGCLHRNGYTGDVYCLGCGAVLTKGTAIAATGHTGGTATCRDRLCARSAARHTARWIPPATPTLCISPSSRPLRAPTATSNTGSATDAANTSPTLRRQRRSDQADVVLAKKPDDGQETPPTGDSTASPSGWPLPWFCHGGVW